MDNVPSIEVDPDLSRIRELAGAAMLIEGGAGRAPVVPATGTIGRLSELINRHRLELVLAPHIRELGGSPALARLLELRASELRMLAMPLVAAVIEISQHLDRAGIPCLVFKGVMLAAQTTGDPLARGTGDIDLLVAPETVGATRQALASIGFRQPQGQSHRRLPADLDNWRGRYALWADYEDTLSRSNLDIDLHWAATDVRSAMPSFNTLWAAREPILLSGEPVPGLSLETALLHACCHALKDQWRSLRDLVDIDRLAGRIAGRELPEAISHHPAVRQTALVSRVCLGPSRLAALLEAAPGGEIALRPGTIRRTRRVIDRSQQTMVEQMDSLGWYLHDWRHSLTLTRSADDIARNLAQLLAPPRLFIDPASGAPLPWTALLRGRAHRLYTLLKDSVGSGHGQTG